MLENRGEQGVGRAAVAPIIQTGKGCCRTDTVSGRPKGGHVEPSPESQIQDELLAKGVVMWDSSLRELTVNFHSWIYSYVLAELNVKYRWKYRLFNWVEDDRAVVPSYFGPISYKYQTHKQKWEQTWTSSSHVHQAQSHTSLTTAMCLNRGRP